MPKVLVVDDEREVVDFLCRFLGRFEIEAERASDGAEAIDLYGKIKPDFIFLDIKMPQMDGLALTLKIRESDRPKTPVIVYSSIGDVGMKARAKFLKVDAHITKLNLNQLVETADKLMRGEKVDQEIWEETVQERHNVETVPLD